MYVDKWKKSRKKYIWWWYKLWYESYAAWRYYKFTFKKTLNTSEFIEDYNEGALNVVDWISTNTKKEDIIFYEVGNDYEISSFFSSLTGRSTPIGWPGHQKQWGRDPDEINSRVNDLRDYGDNLEILNKYNVNYLITKNTFLIKNKNLKQVYTNTNFSIYLINDWNY